MTANRYSTLSPRKRILVRLIDFWGTLFFRSDRSTISAGKRFSPEQILIVDNWGIGDMVLATVAMAALRKQFPEASIYFLGKSQMGRFCWRIANILMSI